MLSERDRLIVDREAALPRNVRLQRTGIPIRYWDTTWDDYYAPAANVDIPAWMDDYVKRFADEPVMHRGKGFLLQGHYGVGKTMAASIVATALSDAGYVVRFMMLATWVELRMRLMTLHDMWRTFADDEAKAEYEKLDEEFRVIREVAHFVVLDDVGKEHQSESKYGVNSFDLLVRLRIAMGRPIGMTTNLAEHEWTKSYSGSMASFLHEAATVIGVTSKIDRRRHEAERNEGR